MEMLNICIRNYTAVVNWLQYRAYGWKDEDEETNSILSLSVYPYVFTIEVQTVGHVETHAWLHDEWLHLLEWAGPTKLDRVGQKHEHGWRAVIPTVKHKIVVITSKRAMIGEMAA